MARTRSNSRSRSRDRRGSYNPRPEHLRKTVSRKAPDTIRAVDRRRAVGAMKREVAAPLRGILVAPQNNPYPGKEKEELPARVRAIAPKAAQERVAKKSVASERPSRKSPTTKTPKKLTDAKFTCKERPSSTKGNGTSRPFVPYCSKK